MENKYLIEKKIGEGGSSQVYLAKDRLLGKKWAIKAVSKENSGGLKEAMFMKDLEHKAIPRIVDIFEQTTHFYIVMDYVEGETLRTLFNQKRKWNQREIVSYLLQLCDVIRYLHERTVPVILCDLKPENIIVKDGTLFLIDFGCTIRKGENASLQKFGGTKGYTAPEVYRGTAIDEQADFYSFGMIMKDFFTMHCKKTRKIKKVIKHCLYAEKQRRYHSILEIQEALLKLDMKEDYEKKSWKKKIYAGFIITFLFCALSSVLVLKKEKKIEQEAEKEHQNQQREKSQSLQNLLDEVKERKQISNQEEEQIIKKWEEQFGFSMEKIEKKRLTQEEGDYAYQIAMLFQNYYSANNGFSHILKAQMWFEMYLLSLKKDSVLQKKEQRQIAEKFSREADIIKKCLMQESTFSSRQKSEGKVEVEGKTRLLTKKQASKNKKVLFSPYISHFESYVLKGEYIQVTITAKDAKGHKIKGIEYYLEENKTDKKIEYKNGQVITVLLDHSFHGYIYARAICKKGEKGEKFVPSRYLSFQKGEIKKQSESETWEREEQTAVEKPEEITQLQTELVTEPVTEWENNKTKRTTEQEKNFVEKETDIQLSRKVKEIKRECDKLQDLEIIKITENCYYIFDEHGIKQIQLEKGKKKVPYKEWCNLIFLDGNQEGNIEKGELKLEVKNYLGNQLTLYP